MPNLTTKLLLTFLLVFIGIRRERKRLPMVFWPELNLQICR